jgi:hypothetical protein
MRKYLEIFFAVVALILIGGLGYQKYQSDKKVNELTQKLVESQQLVQVTKDSWSSMGLELENLKAQNGQLQKDINTNKEQVIALTDISLQWKNKYFDIKNAAQTVVVGPGSQPSSVAASIPADCLSERFRVDFSQQQDNVLVSGYTLTNPAYAFAEIQWTKPLQLELILTKGNDGAYKVYIDNSQDKNFVPTALNLKIDPSVMEKKWYEKISINAGLALGNGVLGNPSFGGLAALGASYDITNQLSFGVNIIPVVNNGLQLYYGLSLGWHPFAKK